MARIFITGSADGLGLMAAQLLVKQGHSVTLHARSKRRAEEARRLVPQARAIAIGDVSTMREMRAVAGQVNALGRHDAIIHNVGIGYREPRRVETEDGLSRLFAVNVLAPYLLTALIAKPDRLVYLSSGMHSGGTPGLADLQWSARRWNGAQAYSDSKLQDIWLAFGVARRWPGVLSNALEPGWVPTRMGGAGAPDDLSQGAVTQAWLAVSGDPAATVTGQYFHHQALRRVGAAAERTDLQDGLLDYCAGLTGVAITSRD